MSDIHRFFRYILPGAVTLALCVVVLLLRDPAAVSRFFESGGATEVSLILALGGVVGVAALGHLLANVYFFFYDNMGGRILIGVDRRGVLGELEGRCGENKEIGNGKSTGEKPLTPREAWEVFAGLWLMSKPEHKELGSVETYTVRLVDLAHGLGATAVGALALPLVCFMVPQSSTDCLHDVIISALGLLVFWVSVVNSTRTLKSVERIEGSALIRVFGQDGNDSDATPYYLRHTRSLGRDVFRVVIGSVVSAYLLIGPFIV